MIANIAYTACNLVSTINNSVPTIAKVVLPTFAVMAYGFIKFLAVVGM